MLHTFSIHPERELIVARYIGTTTVRDMRDLAARIWAHPDYNQNFNGILDYREAEMDVTSDAIGEIAEFFLNASDASHGRAAILVARPVETALNFLFARRMQRRNVIEVFSTWDAACVFVDMDDFPDPNGSSTQ